MICYEEERYGVLCFTYSVLSPVWRRYINCVFWMIALCIYCSSTNVKFHATNALLNSLEFIRANFEKEVSENCLLWIVH